MPRNLGPEICVDQSRAGGRRGGGAEGACGRGGGRGGEGREGERDEGRKKREGIGRRGDAGRERLGMLMGAALSPFLRSGRNFSFASFSFLLCYLALCFALSALGSATIRGII